MCGILGTIPSQKNDTFSLALSLLQHRGPDDEGIWHDDPDISLGHRRLAVIDLSASGRQPFSSQNRYHITFNGEIYNFIEVRKELIAQGHKFRSKTDTEVLLKAYIEWKEACLEKLDGMWAFAIWDNVEKSLFLSRDRMGEKPLFYVQQGSKFYFASEQKALLPFLHEIRPAADFKAMARHHYNYESTENSLFMGIKRFPAAHFGIFRKGSFFLKRYWVPEKDAAITSLTYDQQVEQLRELLINSCNMRLRSDAVVAAALSGGVDSGAITASAVSASQNRESGTFPHRINTAFIAAFPGSHLDESKDAMAIADHLKVPHERVNSLVPTNPERLERLAFMFEEIHEVNPIPHLSLYRAMREKNIVVSLDGHAGDELFCGYESSILHALRDVPFGLSAQKEILDIYKNVHPQNTLFAGLSPARILAYLAKASVKEKIDAGLGSDFDEIMAQSSHLNQHLLRLSFKTVLPTLLRNYDRYSMLNGVEIRSPFLDPKIINFAFSIGWKSKLRNGYTKSVLREAVAGFLPAQIIWNKSKRGFAAPISEWMQAELKTYLQDEMASRSFQEAELINPQRLKKGIENMLNNDTVAQLYKSEILWKEFCIYLWEKAFLKQNPVGNYGRI